jgi:preprotein translocase subunit SecD
MLYFPRWKVILIFFLCSLGILLALPNFIPSKKLDNFPDWLPKKTMNLGLDLRGGSHLLLEVDFPYYFHEQMENLKDNLRKDLRKEKIGYLNLSINKDTASFNARDEGQVKKILNIIQRNKDLEVSNVKNRFTISYTEEYLISLKKKLIDQSIEIIRRRVDETGTKEPIIQSQGESNILLQVPGLDDPENLKKLLGQTAKMSFHLVNETITSFDNVPFDTVLLNTEADKDGNISKVAVYKKIMLNGDLLNNASVSFDQNSKPVVAFEFNNLGARQFGELTRQNVGRRLAIVLDNKLICAPSINEPILGGSGSIAGNYTSQTANDLALLLRAGALPAPLNVIEERTVGPSLGAASIQDGKTAALISIAAVVIFMIAIYGVFGIFANIALCFNLTLLVALLSLLQATLTLPGIAGIVLTMGMSVDANVLIFERIHEESKNGLSPFAAMERGFNQAFNTIIDSNLTTILVGVFLYMFGSGAVKGFAVTLVLGIATSMFSAIMLTKMMMATWMVKYRPKSLT